MDPTSVCGAATTIRKLEVSANEAMRYSVAGVIVDGIPGSAYSWDNLYPNTFKITNLGSSGLGLSVYGVHTVCFVLKPGTSISSFCMFQPGYAPGCIVSPFSDNVHPAECCAGSFTAYTA